MNEAKENEASLLPGKMTERTLMELCAAISDVDVTYSLRKMGASVNCSAKDMAEDTTPLTIGRVMVLPPKKAWSTTVVVMPTAVPAMPRVTANYRHGKNTSKR